MQLGGSTANTGNGIVVNDITPDKVKPYGRHVLIERLGKTEVSLGGIEIPKNAWEKNYYCRILAKGSGSFDEQEKKFIPATPFEVGDIVIVRQYNGLRFLRFGDRVLLVEGKRIEARAVSRPWETDETAKA